MWENLLSWPTRRRPTTFTPGASSSTKTATSRTYLHRNAALYLLTKGKRNYLADERGILATVDEPSEEAMEAMGGTRDTVTGIVSALIDGGMPLRDAVVAALRSNRLTGQHARPKPANQIGEIIGQIPRAVREALKR
mgnify:CR=1 FL=1